MTHKVFAAVAGCAVLLIAAAGPAAAHVTTDPDSARKGGQITLGFRVPNEEGSANTAQVEVDFPTDHPILGVAVEPKPGWAATVTNKQISPPVQTVDGPVTEAVSQVVWSGGAIGPGQFEEFKVLAQLLPKDVDQVAFKVLQTYSNGDVVRWIDPVQPGRPAPTHPAPILKLSAAATDTPSGSTTSTSTSTSTSTTTTTKPAAPAVNTSHLARQSSVDSARTMGIVGIVIGALGLAVALAGLAARRRPPPSGPAQPSSE